MKKTKKFIAIFLTAAIALGISACEEEGPVGGDNSITTTPNGGTPSGGGDVNSSGGFVVDEDAPAGKILWMGYYDLNDEAGGDFPIVEKFEEEYGGTIEYEHVTSLEYFEKLSLAIGADNSPDLVRYEWQSFPHGMSKNLYTPLTDHIDLDSEMWSGMKTFADQFLYKGELYYAPFRVLPNYAVLYNSTAVADNGLKDPYEYYKEGNWTWETFESLMIQWQKISSEKSGYAGVNAMSFVTTTGTKIIDAKADGSIVNNMMDQNVQKTQEFLSKLNNQGLTYPDYSWIAPDSAFQDGNLLFYGVGPDWGYPTASQANKDSVIRFVPFPRNKDADKYYSGFDTFGYLVPSGAKNPAGAVKFINLNRLNEIDPEKMATAKEEAVNPEPQYYTRGEKKGQEKWILKWEEEMYDLRQDLMDPEKFGLIFDNVYGFNQNLTDIFNTELLTKPMYYGESWSELRDSYINVVDAELEPYVNK